MAAARWLDAGTRINGSALQQWRASFPNARCANVVGRGVSDADLAFLSGVTEVRADFFECVRITDAGLAHLTGIHTLDMLGCPGITDAGLTHLAGIDSLDMRGCAPATIAAARARGLPVK